MKETPILFNGEMVRAILEGRKTHRDKRLYAKKGVDPNSTDHIKARLLNGVKEIDANGCWIWGRSVSSGYGSMTLAGRTVRAHRISLSLFLGVPESEINEACHTCDNRLCVNPEHLFNGTHRDNIIDSINKGRLRPPRIALTGTENPSAKLNWEKAATIRSRLAAGESQAAIARFFGVSQSVVSDIHIGKSWVPKGVR